MDLMVMLKLFVLLRGGRAFSTFIRFQKTYVQWFCESINIACRESDPVALIRFIDDGKRVLLVKGGKNSLEKFIKILEIGRNGHGFSILIPGGLNATG